MEVTVVVSICLKLQISNFGRNEKSPKLKLGLRVVLTPAPPQVLGHLEHSSGPDPKNNIFSVDLRYAEFRAFLFQTNEFQHSVNLR